MSLPTPDESIDLTPYDVEDEEPELDDEAEGVDLSGHDDAA
jgi:hypothetical protein